MGLYCLMASKSFVSNCIRSKTKVTLAAYQRDNKKVLILVLKAQRLVVCLNSTGSKFHCLAPITVKEFS